MGRCAIISFRLGGSDGVSIVAARWREALEQLGWDTYTVAGEGVCDLTLSGLAIGAAEAPSNEALEDALANADLVVVENLLTIPLNLAASRAVASVLRGRPAVLHHHDPPWQRERFAHIVELPAVDPSWRHVTINHLTQGQFADRGIEATTIYNTFPASWAGERWSTRRRLGIDDDERLFLHPVRAIERKNIPLALEIAETHDAVYWLTGEAEEGYGPELARLLQTASGRLILGGVEGPRSSEDAVSIADAYAACDLVLFPSLWEGFGNPPVEAALAHRPVVVGDFPVGREIEALGFVWLRPDDKDRIEAALDGDAPYLRHNQVLARQHFSDESLRQGLDRLLSVAGWLP